jgi:4-amino-4-deoxy-L-arabinose transferase-like glycosyltransferase
MTEESGTKKDFYRYSFWICAVLLTFLSLGARSLWGSEDRWGEVCRIMLFTKDFFHPSINGITYFDKPLLSYWAIIPFAMISGTLNELIIRLPSAFAGLLGLWGTIVLARKLWSEQIARLAGWILLTSYGFLWWSRTAAADMQNMSLIILAVAWFFCRKDKPGFVSYLVFYLLLFIGAQFKGLPAIAVPLVAIFPYVIRQNRWKKHLRFSNFAALFIGIAIYLAPFVISSQLPLPEGYSYQSGEGQGNVQKGKEASGLELVYTENIQRFFKTHDHKGPFYAYFVHVPRIMLPWSPLFILAVIAALMRYRKLKSETGWLLEAIILIFLMFSVSSSKRWYYILPILPFCAIMSSVFLYSDWREKWKKWGLIVTAGVLVLISAGELLSPAVWPLLAKIKDIQMPANMKIITFCIGLLSIVPWLLFKFKPEILSRITDASRMLSAIILSMVILFIGLFCFQLPALEAFRTEKNFAMELKKITADVEPENIAFYMKLPVDITFYLKTEKPVKIINNSEEAWEFIRQGDNRIFVAQNGMLKFLDLPDENLENQPTLRESAFPWEKLKKKFSAWKFKKGKYSGEADIIKTDINKDLK